MRQLLSHSLVAAATSIVFLAAGASGASAATYTWAGGSGNWNEPGHWIANPANPGTIPGPTDDVVIPGPSTGGMDTFTVTINATSTGGGLFSARSLTLGDNNAGSQELLIKTDVNTNTGSGLALSQPSTIAPHGHVTIDQDPSTPAGSNQPYIEFDADSANQGTILTRVQAPGGTGTSIQGRGFLTNTGTLHVQSGTLTSKGITNSGNILVDTGATLHATTLGNQSGGVTQNGGTVTNNGDLISDGGIWKQNGGTLSGNPVRIDNTGLEDSGGTGSILLVHGNKLSGTIPAGQTVALGKRDEEATHTVQVQSGGVTVAAGGTLVLQGPPGNGLEVNSNPMIVNGTLKVAMPRTPGSGGNDRAYVTGGLIVHAGGNVDVQADSALSLKDGPQPVYSNDSTVSIAPGAELRLLGSAEDVFTNGSGGSLNFGIASPTRFGAIKGFGASIALGGTATGVLTDGFVPSAGTAFKVVDTHVASGTFASVGGGFTASYAADGTSASLVYGGGPGDTTAPVLSKLKGSATKVSFRSSEAAKVKLSITRSAAGRRVKGHCVKPRRANRKRPRCTRTVTVVKRTVPVAAGASTVKLRKKLGRGLYTLRLTATDGAGNKAKPVKKSFTVKARSVRRGAGR
jgi:hypothetical protein